MSLVLSLIRISTTINTHHGTVNIAVPRTDRGDHIRWTVRRKGIVELTEQKGARPDEEKYEYSCIGTKCLEASLHEFYTH